MKYIGFLFFAYLFFTGTLCAQHPQGVFDDQTDIGNPKIAGSTQYQDGTQTYTLKGAGYNIWFNRDECQFAYRKIAGDFILTANFEFTGDTSGTSEHRKIGWMIRESTDEASATWIACRHIDGLTVLQWRPYRGMYMRDPEEEIFAPKQGGEILQLERKGRRIIMRIAHPGEPLQTVGSVDVTGMKDSVLAGIYICSHDSNQLAQARVWNLRIDKPVFHEYSSNPHASASPDTDLLGCRLEIMNPFDGTRKVIHESKGKFEAPNWMPDGKNLLFNEDGVLYSIPIEGGTKQKFNSGTITRNNNDHVISFDGKMLGISSHRLGLPGYGSTVYVVSLAGGEPKLITPNTPSYLHGWNPDGKSLLVVGQRNGSKIFNLYEVSIKDSREVPLTDIKTGHVDGPEFSPDGKYIYYNANPTGTMQIWRMKPDGTGKEQLTFDQYNSWFPHISPDGKWMVFISFPEDINPNAHPSYKQVMLRLMPVSGGAPRVIAYLFGGQGTLNAPSWSPDSSHIAFVSNSGKAE
jgi:TolB protein